MDWNRDEKRFHVELHKYPEKTLEPFIPPAWLKTIVQAANFIYFLPPHLKSYGKWLVDHHQHLQDLSTLEAFTNSEL